MVPPSDSQAVRREPVDLQGSVTQHRAVVGSYGEGMGMRWKESL